MTKTRNKLKIAGLLFTLVMLVGALGIFSLTASAGEGDACVSTADCAGTYVNGFCTICDGYEQPALNAEGYYEIDNAGKLYWFAQQVNGGNTAINGKLTKDITVNEGVLTEDGTLNGNGSNFRVWTPIGYYNSSTDSVPYVGTFDGNGKTVSGLYFNNKYVSYVGLFGNVGVGGKMQRVGVINIYFLGQNCIGGVVGRNDGLVTDCYNTGRVIGYVASQSGNIIGGVVGYNNRGTVTSCYNAGRPSGYSVIGGVVGRNETGTVQNCYNTGYVKGVNNIGGVVGFNSDSGSVKNCYNCGTVSKSEEYGGGVVGRNSGTVENCYNTGTVESPSTEYSMCTGGVVGENEDGTVKNCYNTGAVSGQDLVGGVVGRALGGTVENCYNRGAVSGRYSVGGVIGGSSSKNNRNNYYLVGTAKGGIGGTDISGQAEAKTATQFESGELVILLGEAFGQNLSGDNKDAFPAFRTETNQVYQLTNCDGVSIIYRNTATVTEHQEGVTAAEHYNADGTCKTCGEQAVARLTTADATPVVTYYATLEKAITAVQSANGSTVMLLDEVQLSTSLSIPADCVLILDLNGKTISNAEDVSFSRMLDVYGKLTIGDSSANKDGKIVLSSGDSTSATVFTCNTLTVNNGTVANTAGGFAIQAAIIGMALPGTSAPVGFLVVENGVFVGGVAVWNENFSIRGGDFELLAIYDRAPDAATLGEGLTRGSFDRIVNGEPEEFTLADCIAEHHYFYGADGRVITLADATELTNVTVTKGADLSKDAVVTVQNATYNGFYQKPTVTVTVGGVKLTQDVDFEISFYKEYDCTNAGDHIFAVVGRGNYTGSADKTFVIEKATPTAGDFTFTPDEFTYDSAEKEVTVSTDCIGMGEITVKYYDADGENQFVAPPIFAGTYTVKISVAEGKNYKAVANITLGTFTVNKATPTVTPPTANTLTYNGEAQQLAMAGSTTGGKMMYALITGEYNSNAAYALTFAETVPTAINAGTYTLFYKIEGDYNYNDVAARYITVTVEKANPTLTVTSPVATVLPGNTILLSYTLTGVKGEALPNTVGISSAKVGDLTCTVQDNLKVTVPPDAVIGGHDKLVVTVAAVESDNYNAPEFTLELEIGMADFSDEIADLETDIAELNGLIANKADADTIAKEFKLLQTAISHLKEKGATDAELEKVKSDVTDAYTNAIEDAVANLNKTVADGDKVNADAIAEAVKSFNALVGVIPTEYVDVATYIADVKTALETALDDAVAKLEAADKTNAEELEKEIGNVKTLIGALDDTYATDAKLAEAIAKAEGELAKAKSDLEALIGGVQSDLDTAKAKLDKAIKDLTAADNALQNVINTNSGDIAELAADLADKYNTLNALIGTLPEGEASMKEYVDSINAALASADATVQAAIDKVASDLAQAKTDLQNAIDNGDKALNDKLSALNDALTSAKAALEVTDTANKSELITKIDEADAALGAAIDALSKELNHVKSELGNVKSELETKIDENDTYTQTLIAGFTGVFLLSNATMLITFIVWKNKKGL